MENNPDRENFSHLPNSDSVLLRLQLLPKKTLSFQIDIMTSLFEVKYCTVMFKLVRCDVGDKYTYARKNKIEIIVLCN